MTHPDGKDASHPKAPRSRRGRAKDAAAADTSARESADRWESRDEIPAGEHVSPVEETSAPPAPVHATGAGGAVALSDGLDEEGDETAKPFLYDDGDDRDDDVGEQDEADPEIAAVEAGVDQELADTQALLRRAGQILGSLGREPVVAADDDDDAEEDGEFQWADDDLPDEQVTLVDEEWLLKVASDAVRRVTARASDVPTIEASADPDAARPPAKLELTLLEPALSARLQAPGSLEMRGDHAGHDDSNEEPVGEEVEDDEEELVPLATESAYEAAVAEAEAAEPSRDVDEISAFAPDEEHDSEAVGHDGAEAEVLQADYHARLLDDADAAPSPGAFEEFAARGGRVVEAAAIDAASPHPVTSATLDPAPISVTATQSVLDRNDLVTGGANTILAPKVAAEESVPLDGAADVDQPIAEPVLADGAIAREDVSGDPPPAAAAAAPKPSLGHEFAVSPGFDIAEALAPGSDPSVNDTIADEGVPPEEFAESDDGESRGWDGDEPLGYESAAAAEPAVAGRMRGGGWTIPLLCLGVGLIGCCLLIPLADSNRRLAYERQRLARDLESIQTQVAVNDEFLRRVHDDASLAERLAQRQMKTIRQGTRVLELGRPRAGATADMSPFQLVAVQPPAPLPPYRPLRGTIANLCYRPRTRLYLMGVGLFMMASGLVLGYSPKR